MNIKYRLSTKVDARGYQELLIRIRNHDVRSCASTGIYVSAKFFDKTGLIDYDLLSRKRLETSEVLDCRKAVKEFEELRNFILDKLAVMPLQKDTLQKIVSEYHGNLNNSLIEDEVKGNLPTLAELSEQYLSDKGFNDGIVRGFRVLIRTIMRFEMFVQKTNKNRADYVFNVDAITKTDLDEFCQYMANEKELSRKYPKLFASMLVTYYVSEKSGRNVIGERGNNTIVKMMKSLKSFFSWLHKKDITKNNPFDGYEFKGQVYGTPIYINIAERKQIAVAEMPSKHLETQRDVFIFHCLIGCRVSDLVTLTKDNIRTFGDSQILEYVPQKTHKKNCVTASIPLTREALALIEKYNGVDKKKRLMPFISAQKYNDAIKEVFKYAGVTRKVDVRNSVTGNVERKPIYEVASSHMARKTFIGNIYKEVQDTNLIGAMSGHKEGSKAFNRYRNIELETLVNTIQKTENHNNTSNQTMEG